MTAITEPGSPTSEVKIGCFQALTLLTVPANRAGLLIFPLQRGETVILLMLVLLLVGLIGHVHPDDGDRGLRRLKVKVLLEH